MIARIADRALKQEEYANATKYYLLARRILGRYEHIASFKVRTQPWRDTGSHQELG